MTQTIINIDWQIAIAFIGAAGSCILTLIGATWVVTSKLTKMAVKIDYLGDRLIQMQADEKDEHDEFWREHKEADEGFKKLNEHLHVHDLQIQDHELRIKRVENKVHHPSSNDFGTGHPIIPHTSSPPLS